jgi:hypothetical protein
MSVVCVSMVCRWCVSVVCVCGVCLWCLSDDPHGREGCGCNCGRRQRAHAKRARAAAGGCSDVLPAMDRSVILTTDEDMVPAPASTADTVTGAPCFATSAAYRGCSASSAAPSAEE